MTTKDKINNFTNEIISLEKDRDLLSNKIDDLFFKRDELIFQFLIENEVLLDTRWEIKADARGGAYLDYIPHNNINDPFSLLKEITKNHSWFDLGKEITFELNEGAICLAFRDVKQVLPFVKKTKLILVGNSIVNSMSKLKREISALESICHNFNITTVGSV